MFKSNIETCINTDYTVSLMNHKIYKKYFITAEIKKADISI